MPHPAQPHLSALFPPLHGGRRLSGAERLFVDEEGRSWTAVTFPMPAGRATGAGDAAAAAVVFTCTSDARLAQRATAAPAGTSLIDVPEPTLRTWLAHAPRLGLLLP